MVILCDLLDPTGQLFDLGGRAVKFDNQQRLDVERVADVDERFRSMNRGPVHHLHAGRNDPGGDYRGHTIAGVLGRLKAD